MIRQKDFRQFQARYHRNGVCGEGFYHCKFLYLRGKNTITMRAIVFHEPGHVAIITDDISERWRGDEFELALRDAIRAVDASQPDSLHSVV